RSRLLRGGRERAHPGLLDVHVETHSTAPCRAGTHRRTSAHRFGGRPVRGLRGRLCVAGHRVRPIFLLESGAWHLAHCEGLQSVCSRSPTERFIVGEVGGLMAGTPRQSWDITLGISALVVSDRDERRGATGPPPIW